jgi:hypothetical protein
LIANASANNPMNKLISEGRKQEEQKTHRVEEKKIMVGKAEAADEAPSEIQEDNFHGRGLAPLLFYTRCG